MSADLSPVRESLTKAFSKAMRARDLASERSETATSSRRAASMSLDDPAYLLSSDLGGARSLLRSKLSGADDRAMAGVDQGEKTLADMEGAAAYAKSFGEELDKVTESMSRDMDRLLKALGLDESSRKKAADDLRKLRERDGSRLTDEAATDVRSQPTTGSSAVSAATSQTQARVETSSIDLVLTQGGKSLSVSFDTAAMNLSSSSVSATRTDDASGTTITASSDETKLKASSIGLTIDTKGFSEDETSSILSRIKSAFDDGSLQDKLEGAMRLTASDFKSDGTANWKVDISGVVDKIFGADSKSPKPTAGVSLVV